MGSSGSGLSLADDEDNGDSAEGAEVSDAYGL
jgi:hypothetical protein